MPGLDCKCGHRIAYGEIPCEDEWLFISDVDFDKISGMVNSEELYRSMHSFLKCPVCGRLWVFWNGYKEPAEEYLPGSVVDRARLKQEA
jgi:hypothetical protein